MSALVTPAPAPNAEAYDLWHAASPSSRLDFLDGPGMRGLAVALACYDPQLVDLERRGAAGGPGSPERARIERRNEVLACAELPRLFYAAMRARDDGRARGDVDAALADHDFPGGAGGGAAPGGSSFFSDPEPWRVETAYDLWRRRDAVREVAEWCGARTLRTSSRRGFSAAEQNENYSLDNHRSMARDRARVAGYAGALRRAASRGGRALDVGSGPFCLLARLALAAGADEAVAVEASGRAVAEARRYCDDEAAGGRALARELEKTAAARWGRDAAAAAPPRVTRVDATASGFVAALGRGKTLEVVGGPSGDAAFAGRPFDVVVHEILGHVASAEGACRAIHDLRSRGKCAPGCAFVPRRAATMLAPTFKLDATALDGVVHRALNGHRTLRKDVKYHCRRFPRAYLAAPAKPLEVLRFDAPRVDDLLAPQAKTLKFDVSGEGVVDGFHLHLAVDLDDAAAIDTHDRLTSWSTTYVRLCDEADGDGASRNPPVKRGDAVLAKTRVVFDRDRPSYAVRLDILRTDGSRTFVGEYAWDGCGP